MIVEQAAAQFGNIENLVSLTVGQYNSGSLILMVS